MARKKKISDAIIFETPAVPPYSTIDLTPPHSIEITSLGDSEKRFITSTYPGASLTYTNPFGTSETVYYPASTLSGTTFSYEDIVKKYKIDATEDIGLISEEPFKGQHTVKCDDKDALSSNRILKTLSAMKGKLMLDVSMIHVKNFECIMTPLIRSHIIQASKRLNMYGKKRPIIARFDDYGNRLPDEMDIDLISGVTLKIVDPKDYGDFYIELKAIELPAFEFSVDDDLPF